jgi:hypothetical protein
MVEQKHVDFQGDEFKETYDEWRPNGHHPRWSPYI